MAQPKNQSPALSFDFETVLASAMPIQFPKIESDEPQEREDRLKAIISNLERNFTQARQNVLAQSQSYLNSVVATSFFQPAPSNNTNQTLIPMTEDDEEQLIAMLNSSATPNSPPEGTAARNDDFMDAALQQTASVLKAYDKHANDTLNFYRDALKRIWGREDKLISDEERAQWLQRTFPLPKEARHQSRSAPEGQQKEWSNRLSTVAGRKESKTAGTPTVSPRSPAATSPTSPSSRPQTPRQPQVAPIMTSMPTTTAPTATMSAGPFTMASPASMTGPATAASPNSASAAPDASSTAGFAGGSVVNRAADPRLRRGK